MFYVVKQGNDFNVVADNLLQETDIILYSAPSAEACWNFHDDYLGCDNNAISFIDSMLLNQNIIKGDDSYGRK